MNMIAQICRCAAGAAVLASQCVYAAEAPASADDSTVDAAGQSYTVVTPGRPFVVFPDVTMDVRVDRLTPRAPEIHFLLRSSGSEEIDYLIDEVAPNRGVPGVDCGDLRPPMSPSAQSWDWFLEPGGIYSMGTYSGTIAPGSWHHTLMYVRLRAQAVPCVVPLQLELTTAGHTHKRLLAVPIDPPAERPPDPLLGQPKRPSLRVEVKSEWIIRGWNTGAARVATVLVTSNEAASVTITGRLTSLNCTPRGAAWVSSPFMGVEYLQLGTGPINIRPKGWATLTYAFLEVAGRPRDSKCQATVEVASSEYTDERMPATVAEAVIDF